MRYVIGALFVAFVAPALQAAPLNPTINTHDFAFSGAAFSYETYGVNPDRLYTTNEGAGGEVFSYLPNYPSASPTLPLWFDLTAAGDNVSVSGADLRLDVIFTGSDNSPPWDVSLVGTGNKPGADLEIWGSLTPDAGPAANVLLWAIDLANVSLYGNSYTQAYSLEGTGTVTGGAIAEQNDLVGKEGAMRGRIDIEIALGSKMGGFPVHYSPTSPVLPFEPAYGTYTGDAGPNPREVPEPATLAMLALGGLMFVRRRRA